MFATLRLGVAVSTFPRVPVAVGHLRVLKDVKDQAARAYEVQGRTDVRGSRSST